MQIAKYMVVKSSGKGWVDDEGGRKSVPVCVCIQAAMLYCLPSIWVRYRAKMIKPDWANSGGMFFFGFDSMLTKSFCECM